MSYSMLIRFLTFFSIISGLICFTAYRIIATRLEPVETSLNILRVAFIIAWIMLILAPFQYRLGHVHPDNKWSVLFQTLSYTFMGWVGVFVITAGALEIIQTISTKFDPQKRDFLTGNLTKGLLVAVTSAVAIGWIQAKSGPKIKEIEVPIKGLPKDFDGFRITQISDVHIGPLLHQDFARQVTALVLATKPDLIAVTGDLVDGTTDQLNEHVGSFSELKAPYGTFFCTGNHEYYSNVDAWIPAINRLGLRVLENENVILHKGKSSLLLAGVYDYQAERVHPTHKSDPKKAAQTTESEPLIKILLAHQPHSIHAASNAGFHLQLSGHTHAGQFYPFNFIARFASPYFKGLHLHNRKTWIYVNSGTGFWGPPNRFGVPSEISVITLRKA